MRVRAQAPRNRSLRYSSSVAFRRLSPPTQGGGGHVARREDIVLRVPVSRGGGGERELCVSEIWPTDRFRATRADRLTPSFAYVHPYQPVFLTLSLSLFVFLLLFLLFFRVNSMCLEFKNLLSSKGLVWPACISRTGPSQSVFYLYEKR